MKVVEFYRGERGNHVGAKLADVMTWDHGWLEMDHDYIQWMFPSNEMSQLNCDAPEMTWEESQIFQADPELQEKVKQSFVKFLDFLGLKLERDDDEIVVGLVESTEGRPHPQRWMYSFNHNMLRVTRVIKSLRLTGLDRYAKALYKVLETQRPRFSDNTWRFWYAATYDPLWK